MALNAFSEQSRIEYNACDCRRCYAVALFAMLALGVVADEPTAPKTASDMGRRADTVAASNASWPLSRGDAQATGVARSPVPEQLELLWKFAAGNAMEATPAIAEDRVFIGDLDEKLYALNLHTGAKLWEQPGKLGYPGGPAVKEGRVYVGDGDGVFRCFAADTGTPQWEFATEAEIVAGANFFGDLVLIGSQDARLYALHATTGELAWKLQIDNQIRTLSTIAEDRAFVAQCDGKLHVVNLADGKIVASVALEEPNTTSCPAVLGDRLFFGTEEGAVLAIDWRAARIAWSFRAPQQSQAYRSSPAVDQNLVVIGSRGKRVQALAPASGEELWSFATKNRVDGSPVIAGDSIFVGAADGRLYRLDRRTGQGRWQYECQGGISSGVAIAEGKVVVATDKGYVYCFGKRQ
jgi:outer membrane protein assembly factor BamB